MKGEERTDRPDCWKGAWINQQALASWALIGVSSVFLLLPLFTIPST